MGGGTVDNVLTQVVSYPSAVSTDTPNGVDQVRACAGLISYYPSEAAYSFNTIPRVFDYAGFALYDCDGGDQRAWDALVG